VENVLSLRTLENYSLWIHLQFPACYNNVNYYEDVLVNILSDILCAGLMDCSHRSVGKLLTYLLGCNTCTGSIPVTGSIPALDQYLHWINTCN